MKKFGIAEWLTVILAVFGGILILLHPEKMEDIFGGLLGGVVIIALFIGYGDSNGVL